MPDHILVTLGLIAGGFALFSGINWMLASRQVTSTARAGQALRTIALANLLFCIGLVIIMLVYRTELTWIGLVYFVLELAVVLLLVNKEWRVGLRALYATHA